MLASWWWHGMFSLPLGLLGQLYAACTTCGLMYLAATAFMGHLEVESHHGDGHDGGAGDDGGAGHDGGSGDDGGTAGHDGGAGDDGGVANNVGNSARAGTNLLAVNRGAGGALRVAGGVGHFFVGIMSPMVVSSFFVGFGMIGLFCAYVMPLFGFLTLLPAVIGGIASTTLMRAMLRYLIKEGAVTTNARVSELPGQLAEVVVGITPSGVGEVSYVVHSKRLTSAAKSATGEEMKKGTKVLIVQTQDHLVLVEPCDL